MAGSACVIMNIFQISNLGACFIITMYFYEKCQIKIDHSLK